MSNPRLTDKQLLARIDAISTEFDNVLDTPPNVIAAWDVLRAEERRRRQQPAIGANVMKQRMFNMREWVRRREEAHKAWTSDELWAQIRKSWPTMSEDEMEAVFQGAYKPRRK